MRTLLYRNTQKRPKCFAYAPKKSAPESDSKLGMKRLVQLTNSILRKQVRSSPIFNNPINFSIENSNWLILGPEKTKFLDVLGGKYLLDPPLSRRYLEPRKLTLLNFQDKSGISDVYLSARYESLASVESVSSTVADFIYGTYNYNHGDLKLDQTYVDALIELFNLKTYLGAWVNTLSNGQTRRLKFVKSLVQKPELLIVDDPFLGLDATNTRNILAILSKLSREHGIVLVLGLRGGDLSFVDDDFKFGLADENGISLIQKDDIPQQKIHNRELTEISQVETDIPHIEFTNAVIQYKNVPVITSLNLKIPKGSTWRIMGNNGTGKTTLLSIITCDHPQSWKSIVSIDGVTRKSGIGLSFVDINNKIGISSPELHSLVPRDKSMIDVILNGLIPNIGNSNFAFTFKGTKPDFATEILTQFEEILSIHSNTSFRELSNTNQKLALFMRAILKNPEILILDEAFSCFDDTVLLERCHSILDEYLSETTTFLIGHVEWEMPRYEYTLRLNDDKTHTVLKDSN